MKKDKKYSTTFSTDWNIDKKLEKLAKYNNMSKSRFLQIVIEDEYNSIYGDDNAPRA